MALLHSGGLFGSSSRFSEEEVDEDLADDLLDGAVTDARVEPVVVADDIGEGVHAFGGFVGQLVDLGFGAACSAVMNGSFRPSGQGGLELELLEPMSFNSDRAIGVSRFLAIRFYFARCARGGSERPL
jgi:hypothetical protein